MPPRRRRLPTVEEAGLSGLFAKPRGPRPPSTTAAPPVATPASSGSTGTGSSGGTSTSTGSTSGGGTTTATSSATSSYEAELNSQKARTKRDEKAQFKSLQQQRRHLAQQIAALEGSAGGIQTGLDTQISNAEEQLSLRNQLSKRAFEDSLAGLNQRLTSTESATADTSQAAALNRARERSSAMSEAMLHGAGESDLLRTDQMSLRNWAANQGEINRVYFDTVDDFNNGVREANNQRYADIAQQQGDYVADVGGAYSNYYDAMQQTYLQQAQAAEQAAGLASTQQQLAAEPLSGARNKKAAKRLKRQTRKAYGQANDAFEQAMQYANMAWDAPGSSELDAFQPAAPRKGYLSSSNIASVGGGTQRRRPEGATLRRW